MDGETIQNPQGQEEPADNNADSITQIMDGMATQTPEAKLDNSEDKAEGQAEPKTVQTQYPAWTSQLNDELKGNEDMMKKLSKFQKISDLAKSYSELESKLGGSITKPGADASQDEINAYYEKLGRPHDADGYSIKGDDAKPFRDIAFKNNLTDDQAKSLFEDFTRIGKESQAQQQQAFAQLAASTEKAMKDEYGAKYAEKVALLHRGVLAYGGPQLGQKLKASGLLFDPDVVKHFITLGEMAAEAGTVSKSPQSTGGNYVSTRDGGHFDFSISN